MRVEPTCVQVFSGAGIAGIGLERAGFKPILRIDNDPACKKTLELNSRVPVDASDLSKVPLLVVMGRNGIGPTYRGLLWLSPPCQGVALCGEKDPGDPRNGLFSVVSDACRDFPRAWVVMENVPGLLQHPNREEIFEPLVRKIRETGREVAIWVLKATDFGLAQTRKRVFLVCPPAGIAPPPQPRGPFAGCKPKPLGAAIGPESGFVDRDGVVIPIGENQRILQQGMKPGDNWRATWRGRAYVFAKWREARRKAWLENKPAPWQMPKFRDCLRVLSWEQPAPTVIAACPESFRSRSDSAHPCGWRFLTNGENRELQGIPPSYRIAGTDAERRRQIGNAVPPPYSESIGLALLGHCRPPNGPKPSGPEPSGPSGSERGTRILEGGKQFDVVIMNPPFSSKTDRPNGNSLWPKFVEKAISLCKEDGYCAIVHPPKWRKPKHKLWPVLSKKMKYLEIHGETDGANTFGAKTRYDWYTFQNSKKCDWKTVVEDERGARHELDLGKLPFLPNRSFGEIWSILAEGDDCLDVIHSSTHHPKGPGMSETETQEFKYPCVRSVRRGGVMSFCYSNRKSEAFVPKVILTDSRHLYPIVDMKGEFGMSHHCFGIRVDSLEYAQRIKKAIESARFKEIVEATKWANYETDFRLFKLLRKDFWKAFVDEHGKEIPNDRQP